MLLKCNSIISKIYNIHFKYIFKNNMSIKMESSNWLVDFFATSESETVAYSRHRYIPVSYVTSSSSQST